MSKSRTRPLASACAAAIGVAVLGTLYVTRLSCVARAKHKLLSLSEDRAFTEQQLRRLREEDRWVGENVGVAKDGYVFYFAIHDFHQGEILRDLNVFYLPDEERFIITRRHYCGGAAVLGKMDQPVDKAQLVRMVGPRA